MGNLNEIFFAFPRKVNYFKITCFHPSIRTQNVQIKRDIFSSTHKSFISLITLFHPSKTTFLSEIRFPTPPQWKTHDTELSPPPQTASPRSTYNPIRVCRILAVRSVTVHWASLRRRLSIKHRATLRYEVGQILGFLRTTLTPVRKNFIDFVCTNGFYTPKTTGTRMNFFGTRRGKVKSKPPGDLSLFFAPICKSYIKMTYMIRKLVLLWFRGRFHFFGTLSTFCATLLWIAGGSDFSRFKNWEHGGRPGSEPRYTGFLRSLLIWGMEDFLEI